MNKFLKPEKMESIIWSHSQIAQYAAVRCVTMQQRYSTIAISLLRRVANPARMVKFNVLLT